MDLIHGYYFQYCHYQQSSKERLQASFELNGRNYSAIAESALDFSDTLKLQTVM